MVRNLLLKVREEQYLRLKALLVKHNLEVSEFMDILADHADELEMFLNYVMIKKREGSKNQPFSYEE